MLSENRLYQAALIFTGILAWASFFGIGFFTNPAGAGTFGAVVLVLSFLLGLICFFAFIWPSIFRRKK